jgi:hypothetical protein
MWTFALGLTLGLSKDLIVSLWPTDYSDLAIAWAYLGVVGSIFTGLCRKVTAKCSTRRLKVPSLDIAGLRQKQAQMTALDDKLAKISQVNLRSLEKFLETMAKEGCDAAEVAAAECALAGAYYDGSFRRIDEPETAEAAQEEAATDTAESHDESHDDMPELVPFVDTCRTATEIAAAGALLDLKEITRN